MSSKLFIYALVDPRDGRWRYIGKSTIGFERPRSHMYVSTLKKEKTYKANWIRGLLSIGLRPDIQVLEEVSNQDDLSTAECEWIAEAVRQGLALTNLTSGGGLSGWHHSEETRAKISKARMGNFRKTHSSESKEKISKALLGRPRSVETRSKISASKLGKPFTDQHRASLSRAKRFARLGTQRI